MRRFLASLLAVVASLFAGHASAQVTARVGFMGKKWDGGDVAFDPAKVA